MEIEEKNKYIKNYLKNYFYKWLIKDIKIILKKMEVEKLEFTLPIILLVCAGIDFSGGLICRFLKDNVRSRSKKFIEEWMGRINYKYRDEVISEVIYDCVRCGSVHRAMYKQGVEISSDILINNHLCLGLSGNLVINTIQFANEFIKAFRLFRKEYIQNNIENVNQNLHEMVCDSNNKTNRLRKSCYTPENIYISGVSTAPLPEPSSPPKE